MTKQKTRRPARGRHIISLGVEVSRFTIDFPLAGEATMKVYGRSAGLAPGQSDLSSVYIEETLTPDIRKMVDDLLRPHLLKQQTGDDDGEK